MAAEIWRKRGRRRPCMKMHRIGGQKCRAGAGVKFAAGESWTAHLRSGAQGGAAPQIQWIAARLPGLCEAGQVSRCCSLVASLSTSFESIQAQQQRGLDMAMCKCRTTRFSRRGSGRRQRVESPKASGRAGVSAWPSPSTGRLRHCDSSGRDMATAPACQPAEHQHEAAAPPPSRRCRQLAPASDTSARHCMTDRRRAHTPAKLSSTAPGEVVLDARHCPALP